MRSQTVDVASLFNQAWVELYCPPVRLTLDEEKKRTRGRARFSAVNGIVHLRPDIVPSGCDPRESLLWYFRHELSHVHHCPYDIRTAHSLGRAAQKIAGNWSLAYLATHIFSDAQININYLPARFGELPYFAHIVGDNPSTLMGQIMQEIYLRLHRASKPKDKDLAETAKEILAVTLIDKPWHTKVQMIAFILNRLGYRNPHLLSPNRISGYARRDPLLVREDFLPSSLRLFEETYGSVPDEREAKEFFKQWIEPRLTGEEKKRIREILEKGLRTRRGGRSEAKRKSARTSEDAYRTGKPEAPQNMPLGEPPSQISLGEEPHLPTSLSKPYTKLRQKVMDVLWKKYWFRSRAETTIIQYLAESRRHRPVWAVMKYPDDWYIEDEIEALDIETSLDEGSLIPGVTTLKWVEEPTPHGQSLVSGYVPSAITVLDVSYSMLGVRNEAAIAAFIAYLSAHKAGGQTSTISFSTRYVSADWDSPQDMKELALTMDFSEFTVFPAYEVLRLTQENQGTCFVIIITDGGWQNIDEAVPILEKIADSGHTIVIFQLPGGEYPDRIEFMKRTPGLRIYKVTRPETDLQGLALSESMRTYKTFLI